METLFSKVKIAHSRRVFCLPKEEKTKISMKDLDKGFAIYKKMGESENREDEAERLKRITPFYLLLNFHNIFLYITNIL